MSESKRKISGIFALSLSNPALIYLITWGSSLFLYNLEITTNILGLNARTIYLVVASMVTFVITYFLVNLGVLSFNKFKINLRRHDFSDYNTPKKLALFKKIITYIGIFWISFTILEIIQFKGIPFISVVIFRQFHIDYATFGLPSLHGLLNALYLTLLCATFTLYQYTKRKKFLYIALILLIWPVMVMSRALLIWSLLELFCIYFISHAVNFKKMASLVSIIVLVILVFGYIGDNRGESQDTGTERFTDTFVKDQNRKITDKLPSGFVWVYLYITTPLNNVVWNIDNLHPEYNMKYTFAGLLPSILRPDSNTRASSDTSLQLYQEAFNVSSYFANYLRDLGVLGASIFIFFLQIYVNAVYQSAKRFKFGGMIAYATLFNSVVMSIFFDYFFSLVTIFQVIIGLFINYVLYSKSHVQK